MAVNNLIKLRRGSDWSSNPTLAEGEPGFDTSTNTLKIGDGSTAWNLLQPVNSGLVHPIIAGASSSDNSSNTFIQDLLLDANGHVTGIATGTASGGGGGGGISNVVEDTTPQLGGNLDLNSKNLTGTGHIDITGSGHFSSNVTANSFIKDGGTSSQFLKADGSVDTSTYSTTDTQLTQEQVEDFVGGMLTGNTETGITVTYQDADGTIDFVVASQTDENFTTADHSKLDGIEAGADVTDTANVTSAGALMDSELTDLAGVKGVTISTLQPKPSEGAFANGDKTKLDGIEASADVTDTANVTSAGALMDSEVTNLAQVKAFDSSDYATAAQGTKADSAQQPPSEGAFVDGDKTKLDGIEANATADQTDEEIQDIVGAMLTGNTETGITVTYQDADGTIDFAVASQTDENFTTADHSKLDGIEASADVTDTANVTSAGALMDSELASIADVKALDQSVIAGASPNFVTTNMTDASDKRFMTNAQETKLDSVESNADVTDTANVTAAGALMDSELTDLAGVKGVTISTLQVKPSEGAFANGDKTKLDGIEANATADQTDEEIQDIVGAMVSSNTETGITVTYQDADGTLDFVVDHDAASNFVANEHIDHTSVTLTAGDGLTGGGDISANRTFAVNVDDSTIEINSDALRIKDAAITSAKIGAGGFVFNEAGAAVDFRVEGDTDTDLFLVDGSEDTVQIGKLNINGAFTLPTADGSANQILKTDGNGTVSWAADSTGGGGGGGSMTTVKANGSQVGGADIVTLDFASDFTIGETPDTEINISIADGAITSAKMTTSTLVLNEAGAAVDFRVEGDTDTHLLFVDGSADKVGIGTDSPSYTLHVDGNIGLTNEGFYAASTGVILGVDGWIYNDGGISMSHGRFGADGDAQNTTYILRGATTNASFTTIQNNGANVVLASNRTMMFTANIVGRRTDQVNASNSDNAAYVLKGCLHNDGYGAALVGSVSKTVIAETDSSWDVQATVTGAGAGGADQINIQCKGANSKNVNWVAKLELLEVGGSVPNYTESNILNTFQNEIIP
jgi:hypothetical protein